MPPQRTTQPVANVRDENAELIEQRFFLFLHEFTSVENTLQDHANYRDYEQQVQYLKHHDETTLYIDFTHITAYDAALAEAIELEYYRLEPYLRKAVQDFVRSTDRDLVLAGTDDGREKEFFVSFYNMPTVIRIRDLRTGRVGSLVSITGTVTRTSEVRPELLMGCFVCEDCGTELRDIEQQFKYTVPRVCRNPHCPNSKNWQINFEKSVFVDWQRVRVQENSTEIPAGSMPRSMDVILRHELVEKAKAGDKIVFTGTLIAVPDISQFSRLGEPPVVTRQQGGMRGDNSGTGVRGLKSLGQRELTYRLAFLACSVQLAEQRFKQISIRDDRDATDIHMELTEEERVELLRMKSQPNLYQKMVKSICPTVFGHDEVKRGVLLMLFGGVHKSTGEGIKLRGDINVCIVGDPSTAKSQFLKYVCSFLPRAIYTSGKASSAAGLTATVVKDQETGEFCVEAGALMLADNGICCIDEFDKMDVMDQVAIHEAMEQQTISITKAGIQATLNARTSILAAANPIYGRYDKSKSLKHNIAISAPIMSRFDLFFVVLDECDEVSDYNIAQHIVNVHKLQEDAVDPDFSREMLQRYIKFARSFNPQISKEAQNVMVECYRRLRQTDMGGIGGQSKIAYRITVRQLESMIRLSEALARLHLDDVVRPQYVLEAYRLLKKSIIHVDTEDVELRMEDNNDDNVGRDRQGSDIQIALSRATDFPQEEDNEQDKLLVRSFLPSQIAVESKNAEIGSKVVVRTIGTQGDLEHLMVTGKLVEDQTISTIPRKKITLSYERYCSIANSIVAYLRRHETEESPGLPQGSIVAWYASEAEQEIETEEELHHEIRLINQVIAKLIEDGVLCVLQGDADEESPRSPHLPDVNDRIIYVHPNYTSQ